MEEITKQIAELKDIVITGLGNVKQDMQSLRDEVKQDMQDFRDEMKQDMQNFKDEVKQDIEDLRQEVINRFFVFETEFGRKIDIMYDYIMLEKEINQEKYENVCTLDRRVETNEIRTLDHEKRISILERK